MINKKIGALIVGIITFQWSSVYWLGPENIGLARAYASMEMLKPFVYRQLVPILARLLESLGVRIDLAIVLLMTGAGIGFYLALRELAILFYRHDDKSEVLIIGLTLFGLILFNLYRWPYDLFTAWFFTLAFLYISQNDRSSLAILFALMCLNRETAFLIIILTVAIGVLRGNERELKGILVFQLSVFVLIQILLRTLFYDNPGSGMWIRSMKNIQAFANRPEVTILHVFVAWILIKIAARNWTWKPMFLRLVFVLLLPLLILMYVVLGEAFEVRVFWEIYPILALLMLPTLHGIKLRRSNVRLISIRKINEGEE